MPGEVPGGVPGDGGIDDVLRRIAAALRQQIGPAVDDPFARTQAFMAAVILEKVGAQLRLQPAHAVADTDDRLALADDLADVAELEHEVAALRAPDGDGALGPLVEAVYAKRAELGPDRFAPTLDRIRATLRRRLDRQLEYAS